MGFRYEATARALTVEHASRSEHDLRVAMLGAEAAEELAKSETDAAEAEAARAEAAVARSSGGTGADAGAGAGAGAGADEADDGIALAEI